MNIPGFIARQFYVAGSLRNTDTGFQLQAQNPMGQGTLVGVGRIRVDESDIPAHAVTAMRDGDPEPVRAADVSRENPISVNVGDRVTLRVVGPPLPPGDHRLEVELFELNLGRLTFSLTDRVAAG
jgi:hypothetical protein